jgi:hypothetical protein
MNVLDKEQILALAPDAVTRETAEIVANPVRWYIVARQADILWGSYSREKKPVDCVVSLRTGRFYCSCASRVSPCKHALGLYLLAALTPKVVLNRAMPAEISKTVKFSE